MKAMSAEDATRVRSLVISGVQFNGMSALNLDTMVMGPLKDATDAVTGTRQWVTERIPTEVSWQAAAPPDSRRIDTVKGNTWFAKLVRDCLRGTDLQLAFDPLPIAMTKEIKDAMKGRVLRASLSTDPRSGRLRIDKRSIELVPLAQPVPPTGRDAMTPVHMEML